MKKLIYIFIFLTSYKCYSQKDSVHKAIDALNEKVLILETRTEEVRRDQLNYLIEKNLLKETYSNNYEKINFVLTLVLGIIGVLGYLGIRDISSIKKEYTQELERLRSLKSEFDTKLKSFDKEKVKFDTELKEIIRQNEEQNSKIKILELKEKVTQLLKEEQNDKALEYCTIGLEISPKDIALLNAKAMIKCRLNQVSESLDLFKRVTELEPESKSAIANYIECLIFANQIDQADKLTNTIETYLEEKEKGKLLPFLDFLKAYHTKTEDEFLALGKLQLNTENPEATIKSFSNWSLLESLYFAFFQPDTRKKLILQNVLWHMNGSLSTKAVCERLNITV